MNSGFRSLGIEFDEKFDRYVQGPKSIDTGRRVGGIDLSQRYAHISFGSKGPDVGFRVNGVDVSNFWAAKGTARYKLPFDGRLFSAEIQALTGEQGNISATVSLSLRGDGTYVITESATGEAGYTRFPDMGTWLRPGESAADYQVMFAATPVAVGTIGNTAPSYVAIGAGQSIALTVTARASNSDYNSQAATLTCYLRRIGGTAEVSTIDASCAAYGWT